MATSDDVQSTPLFSERFVVAMAPTHPLARLERISINELDGHRYLWRTNCEYADHIDEALERLGVNIDYPYNSERDDSIQCMVLAGLGFTILPEYCVSYPGLASRPLVEPAFTRHIKLATIRGRPFLPPVRSFVEHVRRHRWDPLCHRTAVPD